MIQVSSKVKLSEKGHLYIHTEKGNGMGGGRNAKKEMGLLPYTLSDKLKNVL